MNVIKPQWATIGVFCVLQCSILKKAFSFGCLAKVLLSKAHQQVKKSFLGN